MRILYLYINFPNFKGEDYYDYYYRKTVCSGIAFGPVFVFSREESTIKRHHIESSDDEIARFESARQQTISELGMLYDKALAEVGELTQ